MGTRLLQGSIRLTERWLDLEVEFPFGKPVKTKKKKIGWITMNSENRCFFRATEKAWELLNLLEHPIKVCVPPNWLNVVVVAVVTNCIVTAAWVFPYHPIAFQLPASWRWLLKLPTFISWSKWRTRVSSKDSEAQSSHVSFMTVRTQSSKTCNSPPS